MGLAGFTMPSVASVRSLLNSSPPLVYPTSSPSQRKLPRSDSTSAVVTPTRKDAGRAGGSAQLVESPPAISTSGRRSIMGERTYGGQAGPSRRNSASETTPERPFAGDRPKHKRSHSVVSGAPRRPGPAPLGRLQEFSRNPLASVSAVSLPTLVELNGPTGENDTRIDSVPPSPLSRPRHRRLSKSSMIDPRSSSTASLNETLSKVPQSTGSALSRRNSARAGHQRTPSSVPPPQAMLPPRLVRPASSPRSWSVQDARTDPRGLSRRCSISSTSSVSDVAVLATWYFPDHPENRGRERDDETPQSTSTSHAGPSNRLRERLQSLHALDTSSLPDITPKAVVNSADGSRTGPARPLSHLPPHLLRHRHSISTPNAALQSSSLISLSCPSDLRPNRPHVNPLLPPPRPPLRPTTSRLRRPNPLSMPTGLPTSQSQVSLVGAGVQVEHPAISSSPGSMISDSQSMLSYSDIDASSNRTPSPTESTIPLPLVDEDGKDGGRWYGLKSWASGGRPDKTRRGSEVSEQGYFRESDLVKLPGHTKTGFRSQHQFSVDLRRSGSQYTAPDGDLQIQQHSQGVLDKGSGAEDVEVEERYLSFDDI